MPPPLRGSIVLHDLFYTHNLLDRFCFASGAPDNIKIWKFPDGNFLQNFSGHQCIVNTVSINGDDVLVSGGNILSGLTIQSVTGYFPVNFFSCLVIFCLSRPYYNYTFKTDIHVGQ